jgi:hypothetical protein
MLEALLAVCLITSAFLALFKLSHMLTGKILLQHAAMRVARARSVGLNSFMCTKAARVSIIPVAGERIWPIGEDAIGWNEEIFRISDYLAAPDNPHARAILEYENWGALGVNAGDGTFSSVSLGTDWFNLSGEAGVERHAPFYMKDQGL